MQLSVFEQSRLLRRLDYRNYNLKVHPVFQEIITNAPYLKVGDYTGVIDLVQSWITQEVFQYSLLDVLLQPEIKINYSKSKGLVINGANHAMDLKYTGGTCFAQASKVIFLLQIIYPWIDVAFASIDSWEGEGNHCFAYLAPNGFKTTDGDFISTNNFLGDDKRNKRNFNLVTSNDFLVIDTVLGIAGPTSIHTKYKKCDSIWSSLNIRDAQWGAELSIPNPHSASYSYIYSNGDFNECYIGLGVKCEDKPKEHPIWIFKNGDISRIFSFDSVEFLEIVRNFDRAVAEKIMIIQNRGWRPMD